MKTKLPLLNGLGIISFITIGLITNSPKIILPQLTFSISINIRQHTAEELFKQAKDKCVRVNKQGAIEDY
jgi:hypothetical protein